MKNINLKNMFFIALSSILIVSLLTINTVVFAQETPPPDTPIPEPADEPPQPPVMEEDFKNDLYGQAIPSIPTTLWPKGNNVTFTNPVFKWNKSSGATSYMLRIYSYNTKSFIKKVNVPSSTCGTTCSKQFSPSLNLGYGVYYFQVAARNASGTSAFSTQRIFSRCGTTGFNSQFNGNAVCWQPNYGAPWNWNSTSYYTTGLVNDSTNTSYPVNFSDFVYEVKIKRVGTHDYPDTGLLVRAATSTDGRYLTNLYDFGYGRDGRYCVSKVSGGSFTTIQPCTYTPALKKGNNWNTIRIKAIGNHFYLYINGTLVWHGIDNFRSSGKVGINMWRGGGSERVYLDYAKLWIPSTSSMEVEEISLEQQALNKAALREAGMEVLEQDFLYELNF